MPQADSRFKFEPGEKGPLAAATTGWTQGVTLDHGDELGGVLDAAIGQDTYKNSVERSRELDRQLKKEHPYLHGGGRFVGSVMGMGKLGQVTGLAKAGAAAVGATGLLTRVAAAMGLGGAAGFLEGEGAAETPLDDPRTLEAAKTGGKWGMAAGGAGQLAIGEPVRALSGALGGRIANVDAKVGELADAEIASAHGKARKQVGEAVGAWENLHNARDINAAGVPPVAARGPMGLPPNARIGDPLFHVHGLKPADAKQMLINHFGMLPQDADAFIQGPAAPYLLQPPAPPPGPPTQVMRKYGPQVMDDLMGRRAGNADRAIGDLLANPVQIPSRGTALANAEGQLNGQAGATAKKGLIAIGAGAVGHMTGNPWGMWGGYASIAYGTRQLARAAFTAPAVLNRLRSIPGVGRAIGNAAGRGTVALQTTLYSLAKQDPKVAAEFEKIQAEEALPPNAAGEDE